MRTFGGIQALRFIASLLVVIYHVQGGSAADNNFNGVFRYLKHGGAGVDVFFVISGFIITLSVLEKANFDPWHFALNRFFRIYPTYWVFLSTAVVLGYVSFRITGQSATHDMISPTSIVISYLLIPVQTQIYPVAWTLTLEMSFYIIFCLSYKVGGIRCAVASILFWYISTQAYSIFYVSQEDTIIWFLHSIVLEFLFGIMIAILHFKDRIIYARTAFVFGVLSYSAAVGGWLDWTEFGREFKWGVPSAILSYGTAGITWKMPRWVLVAGDSSYILYLMHPLMISTASVLGAKFLEINISTHNGAMVFIVIFSVLSSIAFTVWFERAYISWYKRVTKSVMKPSKTNTVD